MSNLTIYEALTDLIRQHGFIRSSRPLSEGDEIAVCRWLAQQVKLRWPALAVGDRLEVTFFGSGAVSFYEEAERLEAEKIEGGMDDSTAGFSAHVEVWMGYAHNTLFILPRWGRVADHER